VKLRPIPKPTSAKATLAAASTRFARSAAAAPPTSTSAMIASAMPA
jgi:hypothetical protein